jgi:hypothetical protein
VNTVVPLSPEVFLHHWREHDRRCGCTEDRPPFEDPCPCGQSVTLRCGCCGGAVFLAAEDGPLCLHGRAVQAELGTPWEAA